uniref:Uncharacterized protein n=1 Tax=Biomphalaria glabrata TaxID=6526 RepID=A0A2C9LN57_BIOGL
MAVVHLVLDLEICISDALLDNLLNPYWPWFGICYSRCKSERNCFNLRKNKLSILWRAGFFWTKKLLVDVHVVFQAQEDLVEICGKNQLLPKVEPFSLHPQGLPYDEDLQRGAEVFRNPPRVSWEAQEDKLYSLLIYDVGYFRIRGWWNNIKKDKNGLLKGEVVYRYSPPANPSDNANPTLILVFEHEGRSTPNLEGVQYCVTHRAIYQNTADECYRSVHGEFVSSRKYKVIGAQVFFTTGQTLFERHQACTESFSCDVNCIHSFQSAQSLSSLDVILDLLSESKGMDHYVGIRYQSVHKICYDETTARFINSRGSDSEQKAIDERDTFLSTYNEFIIEIGVPPNDFFNSSGQLYTAMVVRLQKVAGSEEKELIGELYIHDISLTYYNYLYQGNRLCPEDNVQKYFLLLYSHEGVKDCCQYKGNTKWDLKQLPKDFHLRAIRPFYVHKSYTDVPCTERKPTLNCDMWAPDYDILNNATSELQERKNDQATFELPCNVTTTTRRTRKPTSMTTPYTNPPAPTTLKPAEAPTTTKPAEAPTTPKPAEAPTTPKPAEAPTTLNPAEAPTTETGDNFTSTPVPPYFTRAPVTTTPTFEKITTALSSAVQSFAKKTSLLVIYFIVYFLNKAVNGY